WIKNKEEEIKHDVKSVEYFIADKLKIKSPKLKVTQFIHFGLTSDDTNSVAYALALKGATRDVVVPKLTLLVERLRDLALENGDTIMLARTHGQVAVSTTVGKELANFLVRISKLATEI